MTDTAVTAEDAVNAAADLIAGLTSGTLAPADVQRRAVDTARELFGVVGAGPADPLWTLHGDVARQYLATGGVGAAELVEWLATQRRREGITEPEPANSPPPAVSSASGAQGVGNGQPNAEALALALTDTEGDAGAEVVSGDA
ncbi:flagellar hook-length control protein [[Mycobacterium] crassicus]|uniref:Flagellar hook-length control protein n=1 Tax=[Mycobacterium] crassicus TaxID=2872309 RepID=A0ABU5XF09_9MYCO|nr:flagellar hook-length control protein [Mycolicibacter sp. MYC098]MEB3020886.1 flagellar hook-length control protein [Mycolicibacter sp. MYC098]